MEMILLNGTCHSQMACLRWPFESLKDGDVAHPVSWMITWHTHAESLLQHAMNETDAVRQFIDDALNDDRVFARTNHDNAIHDVWITD